MTTGNAWWLNRNFFRTPPFMASSGSCHRRAQPAGGTTVINNPRVSNPIKQAQDHEPHAVFVRRWLLALRRVPDSWLFEPWRMPSELQARCGLRFGVEIAEPLVDIDAATRAAKKKLFELRAQPEVRAAQAQIVDKHGSRKCTVTGSKSSAKKPTAQMMIMEF